MEPRAHPRGVAAWWRPAGARLGLAVVALALIATPGRAAGDATLAPVEKMLADNKPAPEMLKALEALPLPSRQTADYHYLLARVYRAANVSWSCGEALAVMRALDPQSTRDVNDLQSWLEAESDRLIATAKAAYQKGDLVAAAEAYVKSVRCNLKVLARTEEGLDEKTLATAARTLRSSQRPPLFLYGLGFINYRYSHPKAAKASFEEFRKRESDPYWRWKADHWIRFLEAEIAQNAQLAKQEAQASAQAKQQKAARSEQEARQSERVAAEDAAAAQKKQQFETQREILAVDAEIRALDSVISTLEGQRRGAVTVDQYGSATVIAVNQRQVQQNLEAAQQKRAELVAKREELEAANARR